MHGGLSCPDELLVEGSGRCLHLRKLCPRQAGSSPSTVWRSGPRPLWWQGWPRMCRRHRKSAALQAPRSALSRLSWCAHIAACLCRVEYVLRSDSTLRSGVGQPGLRRHCMFADEACHISVWGLALLGECRGLLAAVQAVLYLLALIMLPALHATHIICAGDLRPQLSWSA